MNTHLDIDNLENIEDNTFFIKKNNNSSYPEINENINDNDEEIVFDYQTNNSHSYFGYNENEIKHNHEYDPHLSYLNNNGLIGKRKTRYIRNYVNINSKHRVKNKYTIKNKFKLENNSLQIFKKYLIIHNSPKKIKKNDKIIIDNLIYKDIFLRNEFNNENNELEKLLLFNQNSLTINDNIFKNYNGIVKIDNVIGDHKVNIHFFNYNISFTNNILTISDNDINFIFLELNDDKIINYQLFPNNDFSNELNTKLENYVNKKLEQKMITMPVNTSFFLNIYNKLLPSIRKIISKEINIETNVELIKSIERIETPFIDNIPINFLNDCHQVIDGMINLDEEYIKNDIIFNNNILTLYETKINDISFKTNYINGFNVKKLQDVILCVEDKKNDTLIISIEIDNNTKKFGENINISLLDNVNFGFNTPNRYIYELNESYKNIVSIKMISSIFPKSKFTINNNKLYWQKLSDGNNIKNVNIPSGVYNDGELENVINSLQNDFTISIKSNQNNITFNSNEKIRIRFDLNNSLLLGFPNEKTIFSKIIMNDMRFINSVDNHKFNFNIPGPDYILMSLNNMTELNRVNDKNNNYFYKINMKEKGNNNLNFSQNNKLYDTFVNTPILFNEPYDEISKLDIEFFDCNNDKYDFNNEEHSFTLEIITLNIIPEKTNIFN